MGWENGSLCVSVCVCVFFKINYQGSKAFRVGDQNSAYKVFFGHSIRSWSFRISCECECMRISQFQLIIFWSVRMWIEIVWVILTLPTGIVCQCELFRLWKTCTRQLDGMKYVSPGLFWSESWSLLMLCICELFRLYQSLLIVLLSVGIWQMNVFDGRLMAYLYDWSSMMCHFRMLRWSVCWKITVTLDPCRPKWKSLHCHSGKHLVFIRLVAYRIPLTFVFLFAAR